MADLEALIEQYLAQSQYSDFSVSVDLNRPDRFAVTGLPELPTRYILEGGKIIGTAKPITESMRRQLKEKFRDQRNPDYRRQIPR